MNQRGINRALSDNSDISATSIVCIPNSSLHCMVGESTYTTRYTTATCNYLPRYIDSVNNLFSSDNTQSATTINHLKTLAGRGLTRGLC